MLCQGEENATYHLGRKNAKRITHENTVRYVLDYAGYASTNAGVSHESWVIGFSLMTHDQ